MRKILVSIFLFSCCMPAFAIYKCQSGGKTVYSDVPCPHGNGIQISNRDNAVTAGDIARAKRENGERRKAVEAMEKARHKKEATEEKQEERAAAKEATHRKQCDKLALQKKWADEDVSRTAGKAAVKAKTKARRLEEKYELECGR